MHFKKKINANNNIRILRLKTGEQLICKISNSNKTSLYLDRPMRINTVFMGDPSDQTGMSRTEIVFLNNWVEFSAVKGIAIPKDMIFAILPPNRDAIKAYEFQKIKEDSPDIDLSENPHAIDMIAPGQDTMDGEDDDYTSVTFEEIVNNIVHDIIESHMSNPSADETWDESSINKDRENYGNDLDDWSPYSEDYT